MFLRYYWNLPGANELSQTDAVWSEHLSYNGTKMMTLKFEIML